MSLKGVADFIEKALTDSAFQAELRADPDKALSRFDLSKEEKAAIKICGGGRLMLQLDDRLSKSAVF